MIYVSLLLQKRHPLINTDYRLKSLQARRAPKPTPELICLDVIVPRNEEVSELALAVVLGRPVDLDALFTLKQILGRAPAEATLVPPAEDGVHVGPHPRAGVPGVPGPPTHPALAAGGSLLAPGVPQDLEGGVAGDLGADGGGADAGVEAVGLLGNGDAGGGEQALQPGLVGGGLADGVDVDLGDVDSQGVDGADEVDGGVHGLGVEVVRPARLEHVGGDVAGGEGVGGPAAGGVEVGGGGAEGAHEGGADGRGEDLGVVEVVGGAEEGFGERDREVEDAVDHGAEDGPAAGLVDAEAAGRRGGGVAWGRGLQGVRDGGEVAGGCAGEEGVSGDGWGDEGVGVGELRLVDGGGLGFCLRLIHCGGSMRPFPMIWGNLRSSDVS